MPAARADDIERASLGAGLGTSRLIGRPLAGADQACFVRGHDGLGAAAEAELGEDPVHVRLDRREADDERGGDFVIGAAAGDRGEDLALSLGELAQLLGDAGGRWGAAHVLGDEALRQGAGESGCARRSRSSST